MVPVAVRHTLGSAATSVIDAADDCLCPLDEMDLGYLTLDRASPTLSCGEAQKVKFVCQPGTSLSDITYIFGKQSVGLRDHGVGGNGARGRACTKSATRSTRQRASAHPA